MPSLRPLSGVRAPMQGARANAHSRSFLSLLLLEIVPPFLAQNAQNLRLEAMNVEGVQLEKLG